MLAGVATAMLVAVAGERFVGLETEHIVQDQREAVLADASALRARIEAEVSASASLALGLAAYVASHPAIAPAQFDGIASALVRYGRHVRNVALAPENVVRFVYPLAGNEAVLGLDYTRKPEQWDAVRRAVESGKPLVAGPVTLVQGGEAFVNRVPVHVPDGKGGGSRYWGVASVALDSQALLTAAGVYETSSRLRVAMRGRDARGAEGDVFLGDAGLFSGESVLLDVIVPGGSWQLAVAPADGWGGRKLELKTTYLRAVVLIVSLVIGGLVYGMLAERAMIRHLALHDSLTHLPNRRLFADRLQNALASAERSGSGAALLCLDLDGFKQVNDNYGHKAGDRVLRETAERIGSAIRKSDTLARVGGDEFMLILPGCHSVEDAERTANKIIGRVGEPIAIGSRKARVGVSIGVALYPGDGSEADALLRAADRAMYAAKAKGSAVCHLPATAADA